MTFSLLGCFALFRFADSPLDFDFQSWFLSPDKEPHDEPWCTIEREYHRGLTMHTVTHFYAEQRVSKLIRKQLLVARSSSFPWTSFEHDRSTLRANRNTSKRIEITFRERTKREKERELIECTRLQYASMRNRRIDDLKIKKTVHQLDSKQSTELHANLIRHAMLILSSSLVWQASWLN